jgi:hypothetical protein
MHRSGQRKLQQFPFRCFKQPQSMQLRPSAQRRSQSLPMQKKFLHQLQILKIQKVAETVIAVAAVVAVVAASQMVKA